MSLFSRPPRLPALPLALVLGACAGGSGRVQVYVEAERSIVDGLVAGTGEENVVDGWSVTFSEWLMVLGGFRASSSEDGSTIDVPGAWVVDMRRLPGAGLVLADLEDVGVTRFDDVGYDNPPADAATPGVEGVDPSSVERMRAGGYALYVAGSVMNEAGDRTITFTWALPEGVSYADCAELEGTPGFATVAGGTTAVKLSIHGDHAFFDTTDLGPEMVDRLASWIAYCDDAHGGADGDLTPEDMMACPASEAFPGEQYGVLVDPFGGAIATAWDFVRAQMRTIGHLDGEGDCATRTPL